MILPLIHLLLIVVFFAIGFINMLMFTNGFIVLLSFVAGIMMIFLMKNCVDERETFGR